MLATLVTGLMPGTASAIIGGGVVVPDSWLSRSVVLLTDPSNAPFCTGALVHDSWVLTAGHCIDGRNAAQVVTWVGSTTRNDLQADGVRRTVARFDRHPSTDLALINLSQPVTDQEPMRVGAPGIEYNLLGHDGDWDNARITGWGRTSPDSGMSDQLRWVGTRMHFEHYVEKYHYPLNYDGAEAFAFKNTESGLHVPCKGDSGAPVFVHGAQYTNKTAGSHVHADVSWNDKVLFAVHTALGCDSQPSLAVRMDEGENLMWLIRTIGGFNGLRCGADGAQWVVEFDFGHHRPRCMQLL